MCSPCYCYLTTQIYSLSCKHPLMIFCVSRQALSCCSRLLFYFGKPHRKHNIWPTLAWRRSHPADARDSLLEFSLPGAHRGLRGVRQLAVLWMRYRSRWRDPVAHLLSQTRTGGGKSLWTGEGGRLALLSGPKWTHNTRQRRNRWIRLWL